MVVGAFVTGLLGDNALLSLLAQLGAMALATITVVRAERRAGLRNIRVYRASLALLLVAAVTCLGASGSTVIIDSELGSSHLFGFIGLASTNLVVSILAWRALVQPTPRRAAVAGLVAVLVEMVAMLFDIIMNLVKRTASTHTLMASSHSLSVAVYSSFVATWAGALVCMASVSAFYRPTAQAMPEARVIDDAPH